MYVLLSHIGELIYISTIVENMCSKMN